MIRLKSANFILIFCLLFTFLSSPLNGQTEILRDGGASYNDSDGPTSDVYGPVDVSNCSSVRFEVNYSFSLPWSGSGNMESSDECSFNGGCAGDPSMPNAGGCEFCWDFLWSQFLLDGAASGSDLIGGTGTNDSDQSGTITFSTCTNGASTASVDITTQTWAGNETVTFGPVVIICYDPVPSASANPDPLCEGETLNLQGSLTNPSLSSSTEWQGPGSIADPSSLNTTVTGLSSGTSTFTLEVTDVNNCTISDEITVTVNPAPTAGPAGPLEECADATGSATFDLTSLEGTVSGGSGSVTWYTDNPPTNMISSPSSHTVSSSTTVYAVVTDAGCESAPQAVQLTILPSATANPADPLEECADPNGGPTTFDLTSLDGTVSGGSGMVTWYTDNPPTNEINDPANFSTSSSTTVYAVVNDGGCDSAPEAVQLNILPLPTTNPAGPLEQCADASGNATFDLTTLDGTVSGGSGTVTWYSDNPPTNMISDPTNHTVSSNTTVYAVVSDGPCSSAPEPVQLNITPGPTANPAGPLQGCLTTDGTGNFNLTLADNTVNGGSGLQVEYYEDMAGTMPIGTPSDFDYNFGMPPGFPLILPSLNGQVYARVIDGNCESDIVEVSLEALIGPATPVTPDPLELCLDPDDNTVDVDLQPYNSQIISGGGQVEWFTWTGGFNLPNYLGNGGTHTVTPPSDFYGVYVDGNDCIYYPSTFTVIGLQPPVANSPSTDRFCENTMGPNIVDLTQKNNDIGTGDIRWYEDSGLTTEITNPSAHEISGSGFYTRYAQVTDPSTGCSSTVVVYNIEIVAPPIVTPPTIDPICSDPGSNSATIDLSFYDVEISPDGFPVNWYEDPDGLNPVIDATNFEVPAPSTTVYAEVQSDQPPNCRSEIIAVAFEIILSPNINDHGPVNICIDEDDAFVEIDLTQYEFDMSNEPVTWYENEDENTEILNPQFYTANIPLQDVFARTENNGCYSAWGRLSFNGLPLPDASPAALTACDDGSGMASFDLSQIVDDINNGSGIDVRFYESRNGDDLFDEIIDITRYLSESAIVYATTFDGNCESRPVEIELTVEDQIVLEDISPVNLCVDQNTGGAQIDLTNYEGRILDGNSGTITWYDQNNNEVTDPTDIFISIDTDFIAIANVNSDCASDPVTIQFVLSSDIGVDQPNNPYEICADSDGRGIINLDGFVDSVYAGSGTANWTESDGTPITNTSDYNTAVPTSLNLQIIEGSCSSEIVGFEFIAAPALVLNDTMITTCQGSNGQGVYDLSEADLLIFNDPNAVIRYYRDAAGTDEITDINNFRADDETIIYAYAELNGCSGGPARLQLNDIRDIQTCAVIIDTCLVGTNVLNVAFEDLDSVANCGTGNQVNWYQDVDATIPITAPTYNISTGSLYFTVGVDDCVTPVTMTLFTINELLTGNDIRIQACDNGNGQAIFDISNELENVHPTGNISVREGANETDPLVSNLSNYESGDDTLYAFIDNNGCVSGPYEIELDVISSPSFSIPNIDTCANGTTLPIIDLTSYENDINSSGDITWYLDSDGILRIPNPSSFNSAAANNNEVYARVSIGDCESEIFAIPINIDECACVTDAPEPILPSDSLYCVPRGADIELELNTGELEPDDIVEYVLHDGDANMIGNILDRNRIGSFAFNSTNLTPGETYYVHIIAGNNDGSGGVDFNDPCFSQSNLAVPVVFVLPAFVNATADPICPGEALNVHLEFNSSQVDYDFVIINGSFRDTVNTGLLSGQEYTYQIENPDGNSVNIVDLNYSRVDCPAAFSTTVEVEYFEELLIRETSKSCNDEQTEYTVVLSLSGANPDSIQFDPAASTASGNYFDGSFTSDPISVTEDALFVFSHPCGQDAIVISPPDCDNPCTTSAGSISIDLEELCEDESAEISNIGNVLDVDDQVYFVIHENIDLLNSNLRIVQSTRTIRYDDILNFNQTYYVTMVVGNGNPMGGFDEDDPCLSLSNTVEVLFKPLVNVNLVPVSDAICEGQEAEFILDFEGINTMDSLWVTSPNGEEFIYEFIDDGARISMPATMPGTWAISEARSSLSDCISIGGGQIIRFNAMTAEIASISDYAGYDVSCEGYNDGGVRVIVTNGTEPYQFTWSDNGSGIQREDLYAGQYSVTVVDAIGCIDSSEISLTEPTPIRFQARSTDPACYGENTGSIFIDEVSGGSGSGFEAALNAFPEGDIDTSALPYVYPNFGTGDYNIGIFDSNNCYADTVISIHPAEQKNFNIASSLSGLDTIAELNEEVILSIQSPYNFTDYEWQTNLDYECIYVDTLCMEIMIIATQAGSVQVVATDEDGCITTASRSIMVSTERNVFAPNAISPDGNGNNDFFTIYSKHIRSINKLNIFDRWGNEVFIKENFPPNVDAEGWDGTYRNEALNPAVFVWIAEVEFIDGERQIIRGDVSILK